jgi:CRISPR-associated protein Cas2
MMMVIIGYDVTTIDTAGKKRLRKVSKICENYGQRVQNSLFECLVDTDSLYMLTNNLLKIINLNEDNLRIYRLGKNYQTKIKHYGIKTVYDLKKPLIL